MVKTKTVPWAEVDEITGDGSTAGMSGVAGATAPVVVRRRPTGEVERVGLDIVGGYGFRPVRPTPADRAIEGLDAHLAEYRRRAAA